MTSTDMITKTTCVHPWLITNMLACHTTCHITSASVTVGVTTVSHPPASSPPPFSHSPFPVSFFPQFPPLILPPSPTPHPDTPLPTLVTSQKRLQANGGRLQITGIKSEEESSAHYLAPLAAFGIRNLLYEAARLGNFLAHRLVPATCSQQQTHIRSLLKEKNSFLCFV